MKAQPRLREKFRFPITCGCGLQDHVTVRDFDPKMPAHWVMECHTCGNTLECWYDQTTGVIELAVEGGTRQEVARVPRTCP